jgi:hypothetical protein
VSYRASITGCYLYQLRAWQRRHLTRPSDVAPTDPALRGLGAMADAEDEEQPKANLRVVRL